MTISYNASALGTLHTLLKWRGTMLPSVLKLPMFWVLQLIHAGLLVMANLTAAWEDPDCVLTPKFACSRLPPLSWTPVAVVTSLLTFFLVFYGSQSYGRMQMFYTHCVGLGGTAMNWTALVRNHFPDEPHVQWNAVRLILASMHIMYYTLNEAEGISPTEWETITKRNLLSTSEIVTLKEYKGYKPFLPLVWALGEVEDALLGHVEEERFAEQRFRMSDLLSNFRELAFAFRGHCGQISNWMKNPVPFAYFHCLTLLLSVDMLLVSYGLVSAGLDPWFSLFTYIIICIVFLGLREVAVAMSDPFGDDEVKEQQRSGRCRGPCATRCCSLPVACTQEIPLLNLPRVRRSFAAG